MLESRQRDFIVTLSKSTILTSGNSLQVALHQYLLSIVLGSHCRMPSNEHKSTFGFQRG
jgi:hypothetical protein